MVDGFLWSGSCVEAWGLVLLCFLFEVDRVSGPCGLHILGCGWLSLYLCLCMWAYWVVAVASGLWMFLQVYTCVGMWG